MGSFIELNDILQITTEQGFPSELNLNTHLKKPLAADNFKDHIFSFHNKSKIRIFQQSPIRVFLAQNIDDTWLYWGQIEILEIHHDYVNQSTAGTFRIIKIFSPEQMRWAEQTIHPDFAKAYFATHS